MDTRTFTICLSALLDFLKRLALLIEWRKWNRAARRDTTSYRAENAQQRTAELEAIIFRKEV